MAAPASLRALALDAAGVPLALSSDGLLRWTASGWQAAR